MNGARREEEENDENKRKKTDFKVPREKEHSILMQQNNILFGQHNILKEQQNVLMEKQNVLIGQQNVLMEKQNVLIGQQNVLMEKQNVLIGQQNVLMEQQKVLMENQKILLEQQKILTQSQNVAHQNLESTGQQNTPEPEPTGQQHTPEPKGQQNTPEAMEQQDSTSADPAMQQQSKEEDPWKIKKVLQEYDVTLRLLVAAPMARNFMLPVLNVTDYEVEKGLEVEIWDVDTQTLHTLFFTKKLRAYILVGNWIGGFVLRRGLKKGDEIGLCWDPSKNRFNFSVLRKNRLG